MTDIVGISLAIAIAWSVLGFILLLLIPYSNNSETLREIFNPKGIYENINVNRFGCTVLTIFFNLLCPILAGGYWFYWLCTVGRSR